MKGDVKPTLPFDPFAIAQATGDFALGLAMKPGRAAGGAAGRRQAVGRLLDRRAVRQGRARSRATAASAAPNGRTTPIIARSATPICWPRSSFATWSRWATATAAHRRWRSFLLDQYLNADFADQFRRDQPRSGQAHQGNQRREPGPGLRQPDRGRRQRQGHRPAPHRPERVRKGQDHRRDAGRGGVRERAVPADPVHADDRQGRGRAAALRAAAGEPLST